MRSFARARDFARVWARARAIAHVSEHALIFIVSFWQFDGNTNLYVKDIMSYSPLSSKDVLNHSDHKSILQLANLVEGVYTFELKVQDNRGLSSTDTVVLTVKEGTIH